MYAMRLNFSDKIARAGGLLQKVGNFGIEMILPDAARESRGRCMPHL
jgi:hypothetical protein